MANSLLDPATEVLTTAKQPLTYQETWAAAKASGLSTQIKTSGKTPWKAIPQWAQKEILDNIFCGRCLESVPIALEKAEMAGKSLLLRGTCRDCGADVCGVVEDD